MNLDTFTTIKKEQLKRFKSYWKRYPVHAKHKPLIEWERDLEDFLKIPLEEI